MKVGITGHQRLPKFCNWQWTADEISKILNSIERPLIGLSCLAAGTDQLFAKLIIDHDGSLHAVIPFHGYEDKFEKIADANRYHDFIKQCGHLTNLDFKNSDEESYLEAGKWLVDHSDLIVAVWDGQPAGGMGGTADIVKYGRLHHKTIFHINPVTQEVKKLESK